MSGSKFDQEKVDLHVLDPFFIEGTARVAQFGEQKYGRSNWMQGLTQTRILNAIKRHIAQIEKGEDIDEESGFHHAYHAAWGCQVLAYQHRNRQTHLDDRRWSESVRDADTKIGACEGISGHTMPSLYGSTSAGIHLVLGTENGLDMPIMQSEADEGEKEADPIRELQQMISEWADAVYPNRTVENALTKMMLHEIPELLHGKAMDPQEFADVAILLFDVAHLQGIDIAQAMRYKMWVNKQRNWQIDENTGLMSHVKEDEFAPTKIWDGFADLGVAAEKSAEKIAESMKKVGFNVRPYHRCKVVPTGFLTDTRAAVLPTPPAYPWEISLSGWVKNTKISDRIELKSLPDGMGLTNAEIRIGRDRPLILIHKNSKGRSHLETYYCATVKDLQTEEEFSVAWSELKPWAN